MIFKILVSIFHFNIFISKSIKRLMTTCRVVARQRSGEKVMFSQVYVCQRRVAYLWCQVLSWVSLVHIPLEVRWGGYALPLGYPTLPRYPTSLSYPTFRGYPTPSSSWKHQFSSWYNPDIFLFSGFTIYLSMEHHVKFPPNPFWYCSIIVTVLFMTMFVSSLLLVAMTFDRFYSIIRPHKAASFNTIRRTRVIIICTVLFSIVFNIPHLFVSDNEGLQCTPFGRANSQVYGEFCYWFSSIVGFALPFVLLLSMNSVIIHRLRTRSVVTQKEVQESGKSGKGSDTQIFIMLLLVTFGFLVLVTPAYILFLYVIIVNYLASPKEFAR